MIKFIVILLEFNLPSYGVRTNFMGFIPVSEVVVISPYNDGYRSASKKM
jgi:hypothetical protein